MGAAEDNARSVTGRREPPPFRHIEVLGTAELTPHMVRVTFGGGELEGFVVGEPAASVRLLLPAPGTDELVIPRWNGNEFLLPDGARPTIRTFTPRRFDAAALTLDLDMVIHEGGVASSWARRAETGDPAALSGPGRGYTIDPGASRYLLAGDETAIPAIAQLLEYLPPTIPVQVHIEIAHPEAQLDLPDHPLSDVVWHDVSATASPGDAIVSAIQGTDIEKGHRLWCAGEAAAMHRIRTDLFRERSLPRSQATVRGYWKS